MSNKLDELKFYILEPNGFDISEIKYDIDKNPFRVVTHKEHPNKVFNYTPQHTQDICGPQGTVDMLPIIKEEIESIFLFKLKKNNLIIEYEKMSARLELEKILIRFQEGHMTIQEATRQIQEISSIQSGDIKPVKPKGIHIELGTEAKKYAYMMSGKEFERMAFENGGIFIIQKIFGE